MRSIQTETPSLGALELSLSAVYQQIWKLYGSSAAGQAVARLLTEPGFIVTHEEQLESQTDSLATTDVSEPPSPQLPEVPANDGAKQTFDDRQSKSLLGQVTLAPAPSKWRRAVQTAVQHAMDPWESRSLHLLPMEHCVRLRYTPKTGEWVTDDVLVKMEEHPFAAGAMRECFAMKKLSTFSSSVIHDWKKAQNCVAKRYKKEGKKQVYFTDVLVQMDAKSLGEEYNKTDPPKKVDVLQCAVLQFIDRPDSPLYCVEQLIEGDYVKYNSNSGFVRGDDLMRHTPQAFSHYTFELTQGYKICVDIQGVGDLYTDPQIHTLDGEAYGEGNLGLRGMALFFRTHVCNDLCMRLNLQPFDRCESDIKAQGYVSEGSMSSTMSGTISRTMRRRSGSFLQRYRDRRSNSGHTSQPRTRADLLEALKNVPTVEPPSALVHMEVAKLYSEVVLLPELRPEENPDDALKGGIFHLYLAASQGSIVALCMLARVHCGLEPTITQYAHLIKRAKATGDVVAYPDMAFRYACLAADRGVAAARAAVGHAYLTGMGLGEHVLEMPQPAVAMSYYKQVLESPAWDDGGSFGRQGPAFDADDSGNDVKDATLDLARSVSIMARSISWISRGTRSESERMERMDSADVQSLDVSRDFLEAVKMAAEEEALGLPGASVQRYELLAILGTILMEGGTGVQQDYAAAAQYFTDAAEAAEAALKPKLSMKYYDLAAQAEGMVE